MEPTPPKKLKVDGGKNHGPNLADLQDLHKGLCAGAPLSSQQHEHFNMIVDSIAASCSMHGCNDGAMSTDKLYDRDWLNLQLSILHHVLDAGHQGTPVIDSDQHGTSLSDASCLGTQLQKSGQQRAQLPDAGLEGTQLLDTGQQTTQVLGAGHEGTQLSEITQKGRQLSGLGHLGLNQVEVDHQGAQHHHHLFVNAISHQNLAYSLCNFILYGDKYVSYEASKCFVLLLCHKPLREAQGWLSSILHQRVEASTVDIKDNRVLDLFTHLISNNILTEAHENAKRIVLDTQMACCYVLVVHWDKVSQRYGVESYINRQDHRPSYQATASFLCFWKKLIKLTRQQEENLRPHSQTFFGHILSGVSCLPSLCLQLESNAQGAILWRLILKVLNQALDYGSRHAVCDNIPDLHIEVACQVLHAISSDWLLHLPYRKGFFGFGGSNVASSSETQFDSSLGDLGLLRKIGLVILKSCAMLSSFEECGELLRIVKQFFTFMSNLCQVTNVSSSDWLFVVYKDQDDDLVEAMLCVLDLYIQSDNCKEGDLDLCLHKMFLDFLQTVSNDHTVLLDFLTSPETCFLLFFIRYLRFVINQWEAFCQAHDPEPASKNKNSSLNLLKTAGISVTKDEDASNFPMQSDAEGSYSTSQHNIPHTGPRTFQGHSDTSSQRSDTALVTPNVARSSTEIAALDNCKMNHIPLSVLTSPKSYNPPNAMDPHRSRQHSTATRSPVLLSASKAEDTPSEALGILGTYSDSSGCESSPEKLIPNTAMSHFFKSPFQSGEFVADTDTSKVPRSHQATQDLKVQSSHEHTKDFNSFKASQKQKLNPQKINVETVQHNLDDTMAVLIRLRLAIERLEAKNLFPYKAKPLLRLLQQCEQLYEQ